jgi:hypothetical protein
MIKMPHNWNEVKELSERAKLPLGAYVCQVKQCRVQDNDYGSQLAILFDISEGEYKGFFADEFAANQQQDKKWKGVLRIWLPKDDGSDKDELTKSILKGMVTAFENSNLGFTWNWNEKSLEGKQIGILFRNEEWEYDGKSGWAVRPFRAISVASVREGKFTLPKDKPLANKSSVPTFSAPAPYMPPSDVNGYVEVDDEELPF